MVHGSPLILSCLKRVLNGCVERISPFKQGNTTSVTRDPSRKQYTYISLRKHFFDKLPFSCSPIVNVDLKHDHLTSQICLWHDTLAFVSLEKWLKRINSNFRSRRSAQMVIEVFFSRPDLVSTKTFWYGHFNPHST